MEVDVGLMGMSVWKMEEEAMSQGKRAAFRSARGRVGERESTEGMQPRQHLDFHFSPVRCTLDI